MEYRCSRNNCNSISHHFLSLSQEALVQTLYISTFKRNSQNGCSSTHQCLSDYDVTHSYVLTCVVFHHVLVVSVGGLGDHVHGGVAPGPGE